MLGIFGLFGLSWYLHVSTEKDIEEEVSHAINEFFHSKNHNWHLWRMHFEHSPQTIMETREEHAAAKPLYYA